MPTLTRPPQQKMQEDFDFVLRAIYSCTNPWHLKIANDLIDRFKALHDSKDLHDQLLDAILNKQASISEL